MTEEESNRAPSTRDRILGAAVELLGETDFDAITTRALAHRAGVNNALIHYHFGSKARLLVEAALVRLDDDLEEPMRLLVTAPSPGAGAAAVLRWLGTLDPDDRNIRVMTDLTIEAFRNPEVQPAISAVLERSRQDLATALATGAPGWPAADDPHLRGLAEILTALFDGLMLHRVIDPDHDMEPAAAAVEAWLAPPSPKAGAGDREAGT